MLRSSQLVRRRIQSGLNKRGVDQALTSKPVYAYANHGRWVADCPCGGAELVEEVAQMVCGSCGLNSPVVFPEETVEIERLLDARPGSAVRNWLPGESVAMLEAENVAHEVA